MTAGPDTTASAPPEAPVDDRAIASGGLASRLLQSRATWVFAVNIILIVIFTAVSEDGVYFSTANAQSVAISATQALLLALGLAMMLGAGIFDLSLGANLVLSSVVGALVIQEFQDPSTLEYDRVGVAVLLGFLACVITGLVFGLVNGIIIAVADVNSLIATLATLGIGTGLGLLLADGSDVAGLPFQMQESIGFRTVLGVPLPAAAALVLAATFWFVVRYTRFGMHTEAIGSSRASAERAGLRVRGHLVALTSMSGAMAGLAGFIDLARFGSTALGGHNNDALAAVTAVVIGGTLLQGGHISIIGAVWGALLAVILQTGLVIAGVPSFWQLIVVGLVLLVAVVIDRASASRRAN